MGAQAANYYWGTGAYTAQDPPLPGALGADDLLYITSSPPTVPPWFDTTVGNAGLVQWVGGDLGFSGGRVNNHGVFLADSGDGLLGYSGLGAGSSFYNYSDGVVRKTTAGTTTVHWTNNHLDEFTFVNSGLIDVQAGYLVFETPGLEFAEGSQFTGAGWAWVNDANDVWFSGAFTVAPLAHLVLNNGAIHGEQRTGGGAATLHGPMTWQGGSLRGTWNIPADGILTINAGNLRFLGGQCTNTGTLYWKGGDFPFSGGQLDNHGLLIADSGGDLGYLGGGAGGTLYNHADGIIRKTTVGTTTVRYRSVAADEFICTNYGQIDVQAGVLVFETPSLEFAEGSQFTGAGATRISDVSDVWFSGNFTVAPEAQLVFSTGNLRGAFRTGGGAATVHGAVTWEGGTMFGIWNIAADGTLKSIAGGTRSYSGASLINYGLFELNDTVHLENWADAHNFGLIHFATGCDLTAGGTGSTLTNESSGVIRMDGTGTARIMHVGYGHLVFHNEGLVEAQSGTLLLAGGEFTTNNGTIDVSAGATVQLEPALTNAGTIRGAGTIQGPNVINQGIVSPGDAPASLTFTGGFAQDAAGTVVLDVAGVGAGEHDWLQIGGYASLGGTLKVRHAGTYQPQVGDTITLLQYGSAGGTFATVAFEGFAGVVTFGPPNYGPTSLTISVAAVALPGDMNCDGLINAQDIDGFIYALFGMTEAYDAYLHSFPEYHACDILNADFSGDGLVNSQDIDGFIIALFGS